MLYTKHGHSMFDVSSMIQKALRRGDADNAYYAASEMAERYRSYLWKRILCTSVEDCHDMVTGAVLDLRERDMAMTKKDGALLSEAVSIILHARKSRDADWFVCNLQNSRARRELTKYVANPTDDPTLATKNGHKVTDVMQFLLSAIDAIDDESAGYASYEVVARYPDYFFKVMANRATELGFADLAEEIQALGKAGKYDLNELCAGKAVVLMMKALHRGSTETLIEPLIKDGVDIATYGDRKMLIPEYVFDCHTRKGKMMGKTVETFIVEEQEALHPHILGWYDSRDWERFLFLNRNGWDDPDLLQAPQPSRKAVKELTSGTIQTSLF